MVAFFSCIPPPVCRSFLYIQVFVQTLVLKNLLDGEIERPDDRSDAAGCVHESGCVVNGYDSDLPGDIQYIAIFNIIVATVARHINLPSQVLFNDEFVLVFGIGFIGDSLRENYSPCLTFYECSLLLMTSPVSGP